jgi:hypothetical protein
MKKLIALILISLVIPIQSAQASLMEFDNFTYGNVKTNLSITPAVIQKDGPYFFEVKIDNSKQDIRMAYVSLFDCNTRFIDYHRFYVGGESSFGNNIAGWQDGESDTFGMGRQYITRTIQFKPARTLPTNCSKNYNSLQVVLWHMNMDNTTQATRFVEGTYAVNTFKVPFGQPFLMELDTTVPVWTDYQTTATTGLGSVSSSMQKHLDEINAITKAWEAATKALEENKRLQAEIKAKADAEAKAKANAAWAAEVAERDRAYNALNEKIRKEFLKYEAQQLRKSIGKPCKTLGKFKENEAGYLQCISKKGKKVWGDLVIYNV